MKKVWEVSGQIGQAKRRKRKRVWECSGEGEKIFRRTSAKCGFGWQATLTGRLRKKCHGSWKCLGPFNLHRMKQNFQQVFSGKPYEQDQWKKNWKKEKIIIKKKSAMFSQPVCCDLLKEFNSAYVLYIICFVQACYKIRLHHILRVLFITKNKAYGKFLFLQK